jgi:hypothetical protein
MIVHRMRTPLLRAKARARGEKSGADVRLSNVGVVFAPALWRLRVLDKALRTFFLRGRPALSGWAERLLDHRALRRFLPDSLVPVYPDGVVRRSAVRADQGQFDVWPALVTRTLRVVSMGQAQVCTASVQPPGG